MNSVSIRQNINNNVLLQEIKNYLFGRKGKKNHKLNCYTVLGFKDKDDFIKKSNYEHKNTILPVSRNRKRLKGIIKKNLKRINNQYPSNDSYTNKSIKKDGLSFIIDLKNGAQSYLANLQKEEAFKKNNDIDKITEDKGSNLYRFKRTLDYIEKVEERLGFSLEQTLERTIDKFILIRKTDKLKREFEKKIREFNQRYPFVLEYVNDDIQQNGLAFTTELKQRAIFNIEKQDQSGLLYQHYCILNYIELMEKSLGFSVDSFSLLSQIRKDSIKILSDPSLRLAYDEGVAKKELSPLASYEECIKYQQKVNERDSSVEESKAVVENDRQQIKETSQSDEKAEKASIVKHMDTNYSPSASIKIIKSEKMSPTIQPFKKAQVVQNLNSNAISNLHMVQKQKRLSFSSTMTLLLSIYGKPISSMFGMKNSHTSVVIKSSWPDLNVSTRTSNVKALEGPQKKLTSETSQNVQQQDNEKESDNSFLKIGNSIFNNVKNWCYCNVVEPVVNFVGITLDDNVLNSNLNTGYKSDIEPAVPGQYAKINNDVTSNSSVDEKQIISSQLFDVIIQILPTAVKRIS